MERDYSLILPIAYLKISTHTLTWSVTEYISKNLGKSIISTHTLTWSVTCQYGLMHSWQRISTHTLTWSVTYLVNAVVGHLFISTHTLTWSVTRNFGILSSAFIFQLTRSRGAWHLRSVFPWMYWYFNSHAHVERDCFFALAFLYFFISTHTLTWSVTMPFPKQHINNSISTHTLTWSVTCNSVVTQRVDAEFQLTRSRGAWRCTPWFFQ